MAGLSALIGKVMRQMAKDEEQLAMAFTGRDGRIIRNRQSQELIDRIAVAKKTIAQQQGGAGVSAPAQQRPSAQTFEQAGQQPSPVYDHTRSQRVQLPRTRIPEQGRPSDELTDLMRRYGQGSMRQD